jgi:hypothetical protein
MNFGIGGTFNNTIFKADGLRVLCLISYSVLLKIKITSEICGMCMSQIHRT